MADTTIKKGAAANYVWGIPSGVVTISGRITNIRASRSIDKEELQNETGETDGVVYLDPKTSATVDIIVPSSFTDIELASSLTIDGHVCFVEGAEKQWERRGWAKYSVTLQGWDNVPAGS